MDQRSTHKFRWRVFRIATDSDDRESSDLGTKGIGWSAVHRGKSHPASGTATGRERVLDCLGKHPPVIEGDERSSGGRVNNDSARLLLSTSFEMRGRKAAGLSPSGMSAPLARLERRNSTFYEHTRVGQKSKKNGHGPRRHHVMSPVERRFYTEPERSLVHEVNLEQWVSMTAIQIQDHFLVDDIPLATARWEDATAILQFSNGSLRLVN